MAFPLLVDTLDDLIKKDLKRFKWWLENGVLESCKKIPPSRLEDAAQEDIVTVMIKCYGEEMAVTVTVEILKKMGNNNAAEKLKNKYAARGETAGASTSAAAPAAPPAASMNATQGSVIIAPTVTSGTSGTWNITVNK